MSTTPKAPKGFITVTLRHGVERVAIAHINNYGPAVGTGHTTKSWLVMTKEVLDVVETPEQIDALIAEAQ